MNNWSIAVVTKCLKLSNFFAINIVKGNETAAAQERWILNVIAAVSYDKCRFNGATDDAQCHF